MRHRISAVLLALPLVAWCVEAPDAESTERADAPHALGVTACSTPLANGVKVTGISAEANAWSCTYALEVPAGAGKLAFDMVRSASGRGSAFMYVRFGAEPTTTTSDCNPGRVTDANCTFLRPRAGTWYVKIGGFSSPASGLELTGAYTLGIPGDSVLANGVETARYLYKGGVWKCFTLDVPGGMRSVVFNERLTRTGWNIPPELYVRHGEQPTQAAHACKTYPDYGLGTCTLDNPAAGTWFACSYGDYDLEGVTVKGTYE